MGWQPNAGQKRQYEERGYFTVENVVPRQTAAEMLGVIKNAILTPETGDMTADADPMDPMNDDTPEARKVRFRKLSKFNQRNPLIWHNAHCGEPVLDIARYFLGDDILLKYDSCFLKPARLRQRNTLASGQRACGATVIWNHLTSGWRWTRPQSKMAVCR